MRLHTFEERYRYLAIRGNVGEATFGFERFVNQRFYKSAQWRQARHEVITRDIGFDLGVTGYEIHNRVIIHHMTPMTIEDIEQGDPRILDPEYLITTTHTTHNAIHYGDERLLVKPRVERKPGDTKLW